MTSATPSRSAAVREELIGILRDDLNIRHRSITATTHLIDELGMDSAAFAVGQVAIEDRLGVQLTAEDLLTCDTVGDLQAANEAKLPA